MALMFIQQMKDVILESPNFFECDGQRYKNVDITFRAHNTFL